MQSLLGCSSWLPLPPVSQAGCAQACLPAYYSSGPLLAALAGFWPQPQTTQKLYWKNPNLSVKPHCFHTQPSSLHRSFQMQSTFWPLRETVCRLIAVARSRNADCAGRDMTTSEIFAHLWPEDVWTTARSSDAFGVLLICRNFRSQLFALHRPIWNPRFNFRKRSERQTWSAVQAVVHPGRQQGGLYVKPCEPELLRRKPDTLHSTAKPHPSTKIVFFGNRLRSKIITCATNECCHPCPPCASQSEAKHRPPSNTHHYRAA